MKTKAENKGKGNSKSTAHTENKQQDGGLTLNHISD